MKSNGCRDVQHTGLQSTQTRRNTGKQGAQTRGSSAHLPKHPYISGCTAYLANFFQLYNNIFQAKLLYYFLINFCNLELISILQLSYSHWCRDAWEDVPIELQCLVCVHLCAPCLPVFLLVCVLCRPVCWTSLHPFDFIWNLFTGLFVHFFNKYIFSISLPTHLTRAPPTPAKKRCL